MNLVQNLTGQLLTLTMGQFGCL